MVDHQESQALVEGAPALAHGGMRGGERAGQDRERELFPERRRQADADPQGPAAAGPAVFPAQGAVRGMDLQPDGAVSAFTRGFDELWCHPGKLTPRYRGKPAMKLSLRKALHLMAGASILAVVPISLT